MRGQETLEPETSDDKEAAQEQIEDDQTSVTDDDEIDDQKEAIELSPLIITLRVAAPEERNDARRPVAFAALPQEQQGVLMFNGPVPEENTMMDEGISDPSPGDPSTSRRTLDLVEDLINPLQTHLLEIDYEVIANAIASRGLLEQPDEPPLTTSPGLQSVFDEWLVPSIPKQASETLSLGYSMLG
ncbi:MAG: hypothetical protein ALECFALPRED_000660 [Alectoria fallacina]|uniref:Uncharacterized protein n=1 Tax=Alectoria fallacina TaxID=1903189 RepID=A0A8H3ILT9_9LECA|nr:MAG: hypothetical protein ALECFALPRED_000660 [Alectoria fallacina]